MEDGIRARHEGIDHRAIGDAALDVGMFEPLEVMEITGAQVVEHDDFRSDTLEVLDEVGTDKAGAAGDDDFFKVQSSNFKVQGRGR